MQQLKLDVLEWIYDSENNIYGLETVTSSKQVAKKFGISKYKALKVLNLLCEQGFLKKGSLGRPCVYSYGECTELEMEAKPPLNGYLLTDKSRKTDEYLLAAQKFNKSLEDWANSLN